MSNTKKIALMSTLVFLLAVTAIFNFVLAGTRTTEVGAGGATAVNYFTSYRANRESVRDQEFIELDNVIASYAPESAEYQEALQKKQEMVEIMEDELVIESIIKALGFSDVAVSIAKNSNNINVFLNTNELTGEITEKIFYTLEVQQNVRDGNIIIMPVYAES